MLHAPLLIAQSGDFWNELARTILRHPLLRMPAASERNLSALRVVVPAGAHADLLRTALARQLPGAFIPPRITTMAAWLDLLPPDADIAPAGDSERLMNLYSQLRQHGWLKKLFVARRNTDLLPLAQTLLTLCDELTQSLLPGLGLGLGPGAAHQRWQTALEQLTPAARQILSDESQLVWSIWKSQLDGNDAGVARFAKLIRLAHTPQSATQALVWIAALEPNPFEQAFLKVCGESQTVLPLMPDWSQAAIDAACARVWPELGPRQPPSSTLPARFGPPPGLALCPAKGLEQEAVQGAQTVLDWLQAGKSRIAVIAQDRVAARRMRALLERAAVLVTDETGWKLSTTRAASSVAAWFDLVAARAETSALLDFLKSPFQAPDAPDNSAHVMSIEAALRSANVLGGWDAALAALAGAAGPRATLLRIARQAALFDGRKTLPEWSAVTSAALDALGMRAPLAADAAGTQVLELLDGFAHGCAALDAPFSFAEWRSFVGLQMEAATFMPPNNDRRVLMMPLSAARLRSFDAVLLLGGDAEHLPSQASETLFFANPVRQELGLATRESRQREQLRDFAGLLHFNLIVVLSWQAIRDGEPNPVSPWIERLELALDMQGGPALPRHQVSIAPLVLHARPPNRPAPRAAQLLPATLSASGFNCFVACPYQFFATRMLGLAAMDELSDLPQKRDYGEWLHRILHVYHTRLREQAPEPAAREPLLREISAAVFDETLARSAAALGYYMRWQKAIPAYLDWASQREAEGWQFVVGEQRFEKELTWPGGAIRLHGRIDRIDQGAAGQYIVLDYKTQSPQALRDKLKEGEDHQLAFYGLLADQPIEAAHYVALEPQRGKTGSVEAPRLVEWQQMLALRIGAGMQAIQDGAALPANGIERICQYCEVRGLCRKGAW